MLVHMLPFCRTGSRDNIVPGAMRQFARGGEDRHEDRHSQNGKLARFHHSEALLAEVGAKASDQVDMGVENGKIVIAPIRKKPRAGWAEASKRLAATRDGDLVW